MNLIVKRKRKGFTLLELLLASVILAVALSVLLLEFLGCAVLSEAARNLTRAITHAQYVMEDIKNTTFINIKSKIDNGDWDWDSTDISNEGLTPLRNEIIDTNVSGTDLLDVTVNVSWQNKGGRAQSTFLETLIAEP